MKTPFFTLCIVFLQLVPVISIAQGFTGNGSNSNPYSGTVPGSQVWTGSAIYADDIVVPSGVILTISSGIDFASNLDMNECNLTIEAGGTFIINPNVLATITNIENEGTLILESTYDETGTASLIHDYYSGSGSTIVRLYLSGGTTAGGDYIWHYISVPQSNINASTFNTLNLAQYIESLSGSNDNSSGWVAYGGYQYSSSDILDETFNTLKLGQGYNYYNQQGSVVTLTGDINLSGLTIDLSYSGPSDYQGYNLIGNPFSSFLDWHSIYNGGATANIINAIYFTRRGKIAAYVNGVGVNGADQYIPPLQGFFVKSTAPDGIITFNPDFKCHTPDRIRFKKKNSDVIHTESDTISLIRIDLSLPGDSADFIVRFNKQASPFFDKDLDAYTFSRTMGDVNLWTTTEGSDYCINALPFPDTFIEIPIGISVKIPGMYRLGSREIRKLADYNIALKDLQTSMVVDLNKGEFLEFTALPGIIENRFSLVVTKSSTGMTNISAKAKAFDVYLTQGRTINIKLLGGDEIVQGTVAVYDLSGKCIIQTEKYEWSGKDDSKQLALPNGSFGIFLVVIDNGSQRFIEKVIVH